MADTWSTMGRVAFGLAALAGAAGVAPDARAMEEAPCARITVASDGACESLRAQVDLSRCGAGERLVAPARIACRRDFVAEVSAETAAYLYSSVLTRNGDDTWAPGSVRRRPRSEAAETPAPPAAGAAGAGSVGIASAAGAEAGAPLSVQGHFRIRGEVSDQTDLATHRSATYLRIRPEIRWNPSPEATVVLQPQATKALGSQDYVASGAAANTRTDTSGGTYDPAIAVHQAYGIYRPADSLQFLAGRQALAYGNELVVGASDWNNVGRSFDAVRARASCRQSQGFVDLFASKVVDTNISTSGPGDKDFYGAYASGGWGEALRALDLYALYLRDSSMQATPALATDLWTLGVRAQSTLGAIDYRAEYTKQLDATHGFQGDLEVGYTIDGTARPRFGLEGFIASSEYNQLFPTTHKWLGYADVLGRRNVQGFAAHLSAAATRQLGLALDYHWFDRVSAAVPAFRTSGAALGSGTATAQKHIGSEVDLVARFQASPAVLFSAGGALFFEGRYLEDQFRRRAIDFYYAQMEIKF